MWQTQTGIERRSTLEVHEDEGDTLRWVPRGERDHEGSQQLALAGPGGPREQTVRTIADQVEIQSPFTGRAETCDEPVVVMPPGICDRRRGRQSEELVERERSLHERSFRVAQTGERPRHPARHFHPDRDRTT